MNIENIKKPIDQEDDDLDLDSYEGVKKALLTGRNLYNIETGEFWWLYNITGSVATTTVHLDDQNLLEVVDDPDFDLYEDIVGSLNYESFITESPEYYAENEDDYPDAPDYDERDEVFARIASEEGWVVATPENVRRAVASRMFGRVSRTVFSGERYDVVAYYDEADLATIVDADIFFHPRVASLGNLMSYAKLRGFDLMKPDALRLMVRAAWNLDLKATGGAIVSEICDAMDGELASLLDDCESSANGQPS